MPKVPVRSQRWTTIFACPSQRTKGKPLDPLICAFICVSQFLLPHPQVFHLIHNLIDSLLNPPQLGLDGFQLLRSLDGRPISRVGADIDVQLDMAEVLIVG